MFKLNDNGVVVSIVIRFTNLTAWNLGEGTDTSSPSFGWGFDVTRFGDHLDFTRPSSGADDILLLPDGYWSSSCTVFAQCVFHDAGVKIISIGGRPCNGPMQSVGGVKSSHVYGHTDIRRYIDIVKDRLPSNDAAILKYLDRHTDYIPNRIRYMAVNMLDSNLPGSRDNDPPAQFVTEYANCDMLWT
ncbi:pyridine nucleotide-disulfide oxidoreductase family [Fusarium heterosporum]|uniref:Pyridine nucleotide-disulfide oxidoreductase family n=1 Tax=Fusarium heterosporum TaxID=42747 RepID=A0A8H5X049_FUSHE|nr:pyridine nucleotide-disulfide oxidoreductase family [Fusarium heterosporum]